jgi:hypothetical protein
MPWTPEDASKKTHRAKTAKQRREWAHIANGVLAKTGNDALAIREANGVLAKHEFSAHEEKAMRRKARKGRE